MDTQTITTSGLQRLTRISRERLKKQLEDTEPIEWKSGVARFELGRAIRALLNAGESQQDREARLRADIMEEKLRRIRGESLDAQEVRFAASEILIRIRQVIRTSELPHEVIHRVTGLLRHEVETLPERLKACEFDEANPQTEQPTNRRR